MPFAIVQTSRQSPSSEQLRQAFSAASALGTLTGLDADVAARDAFGIVVENLPLQSARTLREALTLAGVATEIVDERELPVLPRVKSLRRADCGDEGLTVYDALQRPRIVRWPQVVLVAAGRVVSSAFVEQPAHVVLLGRAAVMLPYDPVRVNVKHKEARRSQLVLEVVLEGVGERYRAVGGEVHCDYLGPRLAGTGEENFVLLVRDVIGFASGAILNRGAEAMKEDAKVVFPYARWRAFEKEMVWLLWRAGGTADNAAR